MWWRRRRWIGRQRRRQWRRCSGGVGSGCVGGGGSVDKNGGSGLGGSGAVESGGGASCGGLVDRDSDSGVDTVKLTSLVAAALVVRSTETAAAASMQQSCRVWLRRRRQWISRQRRRQWRRCSGGVRSGCGGSGGQVDRDSGSGIDAVEVSGLVALAVVAQLIETAAVASMQWS